MRIETNERLVKRNKQIGTYLFLFSMAVLVGGFILANGSLFNIEGLESISDALYLTIMPLVLVIGMISTFVSVRMTNLWFRVPRPENLIEQSLKGLGKKGALYNYFHFPARHVLIAPQGVFAIVTRYQDGSYRVEGSKWRTFRTPIGRIFSIFRMDGINNPTLDAQMAAEHVQDILRSINAEVPVHPLILFTDSRARLEIVNPTVPVLYADPKQEPNLKDYLRDYPKEGRVTLTQEQIDQFDEATRGSSKRKRG
jgi:hypothetical protein